MSSYQDNIRPWAVFQRLPSGFSELCGRFKKRSDADAYMSILRRGDGVFEVAFDRESATPTTGKQGDAIQARN
ncbi:MAG: hypothetical protein V7L23_34540 [Nostoc sp.]|uniref:hypothetical protein n=1 Tax=Nostoc sp. TaxID=1180 RepID=UPI002FF07338